MADVLDVDDDGLWVDFHVHSVGHGNMLATSRFHRHSNAKVEADMLFRGGTRSFGSCRCSGRRPSLAARQILPLCRHSRAGRVPCTISTQWQRCHRMQGYDIGGRAHVFFNHLRVQFKLVYATETCAVATRGAGRRTNHARPNNSPSHAKSFSYTQSGTSRRGSC